MRDEPSDTAARVDAMLTVMIIIRFCIYFVGTLQVTLTSEDFQGEIR